MDKVQFKATLYRKGEIPLRDGGEPVVPDDAPETEPEYTRPHVWGFIALLWCIVFISMHGAFLIYVALYPLDPADHVWQAIPIGVAAYGVLFAITLFVRWLARRER